MKLNRLNLNQSNNLNPYIILSTRPNLITLLTMECYSRKSYFQWPSSSKM